MADELEEVKTQVAIANRILADVGLADGVRASLGHASMRLPSDPNRFIVKGRGYRIDVLSRMRPEDMVTCDLEGRWVDGPPASMPCNEIKMHSCIYKSRPDVQSVVHVHPDFTVLLTSLRQPIRPLAQEGALLVRRPLPVYPHAKIVTSDEEGQEVARLLGDGPAVLMLGHGAATVGKSLQESVTAMVHLEHQARLSYRAYSAAGPDYPCIPDELLEEMAAAPSPHTEPHLRDRAAAIGNPRRAGIWPYLTEIASATM
jgi:ribulose-5-phosphate 4-epimerase/fuculose-1-phosphate aldolase